MRRRVSRGQQVFRTACELLTVTEVKPRLGDIVKHVEDLEVVAARLAASAVAQDVSNRAYHAAARAARAQARQLRREYLAPVAGTAKTLFRDEPTVREALAMPKREGYHALVTAAQGMARHAAERKDRFVAAGFREDFVEQLDAAALALEAAADVTSGHRARRAAATSAMLKDYAIGRDLLRLLDTMVTPWLEQNLPARLAEWESLTHFARVTPASDATEIPGDLTTAPSPNVTTISDTEAHAA